MSWKNILKNDVEKLKQNFINHFNLQGADLGKVLEAISDIQYGRHYDAVNEILEVSGLDANNPSNKNLFGQALNEIKEGKMPSRQAAPKPPAPKPAHAVIPDTHRDKPKKDPKETPNPAIIPDTHRDKGIPWRK